MKKIILLLSLLVVVLFVVSCAPAEEVSEEETTDGEALAGEAYKISYIKDVNYYFVSTVQSQQGRTCTQECRSHKETCLFQVDARGPSRYEYSPKDDVLTSFGPCNSGHLAGISDYKKWCICKK
tara:strand:+ start:185 stop:556 length:372 start_codon:yes stop_codon:yes gene_type:complete